jgi:hypothetical protein
MGDACRRPLSLLHEVGQRITVTALGPTGVPVELMQYVYAPKTAQYESPRPFIHPMRTPSGRLVTAFRPWDHVWHTGVSLAFPNVGSDNFWGGPTYTRGIGGYADLGNNGSQDHERTLEAAYRGDSAVFSHELTWRRKPLYVERGAVLLSEVRTLTATLFSAESAWILHWRSCLTNRSNAPIAFGSPTTEGRPNAGYGGLFWRGPRSFVGGDIIASNGATGECVRGMEGLWAGFSGRHDEEDASSTVLFIDQTPRQGLDIKWFARSEPFPGLCPAPFFDRTLSLEYGHLIELQHVVVIADGASDASRMATLAAAARALTADPVTEEVSPR